MQITVHDSGMRKVAFIDNEKQGTLNFYNDKWIRILGAFGSTFEFTVFKKSVKSDLLFEKAYHHLNDRSFISFEFKGKTQLFTVLQTEEDEETIHLYCESPTLELLNEYVGTYKADQAYTFLEYCKMWNMLDFSAINVGINEIKDKELALEWTGEDTKLKRLMSLANYFGVEIELEKRLNFDSTLDQFLINIYKANNGDDIQGLGQRRADVVLEYGKNVEKITRKVDKTNIVNAIKPVGKKEITKKITTTTPKSRQVVVPASSVRKWKSGNINYSGHTISGSVVQQILDYCVSYRVLPSGVISQLYLESFWGASTVARVDNNWSGMTGGAQTRPSGVKVTAGMARPANEGGTYMHYASVSDFIKDYMFLLAEQKTSSGAKMYGVKGKNNIDDYTKGLFRVGGALYDYAAAGYSHYIYLMKDIRSGVNRQTKGSMDLLDKLFMQGGTTSTGAPRTTITKKATATENALNKVKALKGHRVGSGQCYALSAYYANILGGAGLGGGVTSLRGLIGGGIRASHIGEDYAWSNYGWSVVRPTNVSQLKAGGIANIKPNLSYLGTGYYGHTVIIKSVNARTITVYEQNYNGKQYVIENSYSTNAYLGAIQTVVYPKEITHGAIVGGIATTTNDDGTVTTTEYYSETTVEEVKETVDLYISDTNKQKWLNEDGELEFYLKNGMLYAPISKQMYPSVLSGTETTDNWIRRDIAVETDQESVLIATALREMRKNAYPAITYELEGWFDGEIGDTLDIRDTGFVPTLLLNARIYRQEICFTQPETSRTEFANFKELENMISSGLMSDWERMAEEARPYELHLATDNGTSFKNNTGTSLLSARLEKGGREIDDAIIFYKVGDAIVGSGPSLTVNATDFDKVWPVTIEAYVNEQLVASRQLTFIDVEDGTDGVGVNSVSITYGLSKSASTQPTTWTTDLPVAGQGDYLWTRKITDYTDDNKEDTIEYTYSYQGKTGVAGTSIKVSKIEYQVGASGTVAPSGAWLTTIPSVPDGQFLWSKTTMSDNAVIYGISKQGATGPKGDKGADGVAGKDGVGVKITTITYGISANETTQPTNWTTSVPALVKGQYLWTKTVWAYTDSTTETGYVKTYIAKDGNNGTDGIAGKDGVGIKTTTITYQASTSGTVTPNGTWTSTIPSVPSGQFLWTKTVWTYTDNTNETGYSVAKMGETGAKGDKGDTGPQGLPGTDGLQGPKGDQGIQGPVGADGKSSYTHIAYATNSTGTTGFSVSDNVGKTYIGMYVDNVATDSTDPNKYKWNLIKGADGAQGIPGKQGADGKTPYFHTAWSYSADGTDRFTTVYPNLNLGDNTKTFVGADGGNNLTGSIRIDPATQKTQNGDFYYLTAKAPRDNYDWFRFYLIPELGTPNMTKVTVKPNAKYTFSVWLKGTGQHTIYAYNSWTAPNTPWSLQINLTSDWKLYTFTVTSKDVIPNNTVQFFIRSNNGTEINLKHPKVEEGSIATPYMQSAIEVTTADWPIYIGQYTDFTQADSTNPSDYTWSPSPEYIDAKIDTKADEEFTIEQLNLIAENQRLLKAENDAKASMEEVQTRTQELLDQIKRIEEGQKVSEQTMISNANRVVQILAKLGDMQLITEAITQYMSYSEDGLVLKMKNGASSVRVTTDRISFYSGGTETAFISQGFLQIESGVFTLRLQIGHYLFEEDANGMLMIGRVI